jgi:ABC-2 type transport system permease protein
LARNVRYLVFALGLPLGFYLLYDAMYGRDRIGGVAFSLVLMVAMATFGAVGTTLNSAGTQTALDREAGWVRQLRLTPLPPWAYVSGQLAVAMVASLAAVCLIAAAALAVNRIAPSLPVAEGVAAVWLGSASYAAIGLALAYLLDASTVGYGALIAYLASGFLGGLWVPLSLLPPWFTTVAHLLPSFHIADMAWRLVAGRPVPLGDVGVLALYAAAFGALAAHLYRQRG